MHANSGELCAACGGRSAVRMPEHSATVHIRSGNFRKVHMHMVTCMQVSVLATTQMRDRRRYRRWAARHSIPTAGHSRADAVVRPVARPRAHKGAAAAAGVAAGAAATALIIPVLNEEGTLPEMLAHLRTLQPPPAEIIFVDGGSTDRCSPPLSAQCSLP